MKTYFSELHDYNVSRESKFPAYFQITTTRACNAQCPMCPHSKISKKRWDNGRNTVFMSDALYSKIVDEISQYKDTIKMVSIYGPGEPFTDTKIIKRIKMLKDAGIVFVSISTNAQLLSDENAIGMLNAGIDEIRISIDTLNPEKYEKIRVGLDFNTVMENIENMIRRRNELAPSVKIRLRAVMLPELTRDELEEWRDHWTERLGTNDEIDLMPLHNWADKIHAGDDSEPCDTACIAPFTTIVIDVDGSVPLCGPDLAAIDYNRFIIGNVNSSTIYEIFNGDTLTNIRNLHGMGRRGEIELCKNCTAWVVHAKERSRGIILPGE